MELPPGAKRSASPEAIRRRWVIGVSVVLVALMVGIVLTPLTGTKRKAPLVSYGMPMYQRQGWSSTYEQGCEVVIGWISDDSDKSVQLSFPEFDATNNFTLMSSWLIPADPATHGLVQSGCFTGRTYPSEPAGAPRLTLTSGQVLRAHQWYAIALDIRQSAAQAATPAVIRGYTFTYVYNSTIYVSTFRGGICFSTPQSLTRACP